MFGLTPYQRKEVVLVETQSAGDIIQGMLSYHDLYKSEYDKLALQFVAGNNYAIGKKIFDFLKKNTKYKIESDKKQYLKSPSAILYSGSNDCKNYSLFSGGILDALNRLGYNINWCYRYASYNILDKVPQHVFVVINPNTNNEIWVDAVLKKYDQRVQPSYKIDKKINDMALVALSGVGEQIGISFKKKTTTKAERKEGRKEKIKKIANGIKSGLKVTLKVGAAPARNAFLALTKVNFRSLATNLNNAIKSGKRAELEKFWANSGGNPSALIKSIEVGSGKKRLGGIGVVDPVTQAALITAASGLVLALIKQGLLPKEAAIPEGATGDDIDLAADQGDTTWDKVLRFGKEALKDAIVNEGSGGGPTAGGTLLTGGTIDKSGNITSGGNTGGINNTLLLGGAGVVAAIVLMRKK